MKKVIYYFSGERVCLCHNIEIQEGKPVFQHHCANCMACIVNCPKRAIGYEIKEGDKVNLDTSSPKTPIVKIMGLPKNRKFYRNPYIRTSDMMKDEEYYE